MTADDPQAAALELIAHAGDNPHADYDLPLIDALTRRRAPRRRRTFAHLTAPELAGYVAALRAHRALAELDQLDAKRVAAIIYTDLRSSDCPVALLNYRAVLASEHQDKHPWQDRAAAARALQLAADLLDAADPRGNRRKSARRRTLPAAPAPPAGTHQATSRPGSDRRAR